MTHAEFIDAKKQSEESGCFHSGDNVWTPDGGGEIERWEGSFQLCSYWVRLIETNELKEYDPSQLELIEDFE